MGLAFFDPDISLEDKRKMVNRLTVDRPVVNFIDGRKVADPQELLLYSLSDLVSSNTKKFFSRIEISLDFTESDPSEWSDNEDYMKGVDYCKSLMVTNDTAERGVKFMQDYNRVLTLDPQENQFLLQVVDEYRKKYPKYTKSCLME